ncbi:DUF2911 domain-containing protein [Reichenbachiella sp. MALMAid0571]|uniref:DUF2911 domain-containing protein n=1 Tax=Reichenbachiella sp. MALMAid0571 TaxID=3143939 RepID=UPI0032E045A1
MCLYLIALSGCGIKSGKEMAQVEADYMLFRYKDKMDRPSPPNITRAQVGRAKVSIDYSQPSVKERKIWGDLVKYDKIWRTGANEANIFETSGPLLVGSDTIPVGKFSLFTIPGKDKWTVIFNKIYDQWGVYDYKQSEDVARIEVSPYNVGDLQEKMTFEVDSTGKIVFAWEYLRFSFNVKPIDSN